VRDTGTLRTGIKGRNTMFDSRPFVTVLPLATAAHEVFPSVPLTRRKRSGPPQEGTAESLPGRTPPSSWTRGLNSYARRRGTRRSRQASSAAPRVSSYRPWLAGYDAAPAGGGRSCSVVGYSWVLRLIPLTGGLPMAIVPLVGAAVGQQRLKRRELLPPVSSPASPTHPVWSATRRCSPSRRSCLA
jgi:hypothetical protein